MPAPIRSGIDVFEKNFEELVLKPYEWDQVTPTIEDFSESTMDILGALMECPHRSAPGASTLLSSIFISLSRRTKESYIDFVELGKKDEIVQVEALIDALDDQCHAKTSRKVALLKCFSPSPSAADCVDKCAEYYGTTHKHELYVAIFVLMTLQSMKFAEESLSKKSKRSTQRNATFRCCVNCLGPGPQIRGTAKLLSKYIKYIEAYREKAGAKRVDNDAAPRAKVPRSDIRLKAREDLKQESIVDLETLHSKLSMNRRLVGYLCENIHGQDHLQTLLAAVGDVCTVATQRIDKVLDSSRGSDAKAEMVAMRSTLVQVSDSLEKLFDPKDKLKDLRKDWETLRQSYPSIMMKAPIREGTPVDVVNFLRVALPGVLALTKDIKRRAEAAEDRELRLDEMEKEVEKSTEVEKRAYRFLRSQIRLLRALSLLPRYAEECVICSNYMDNRDRKLSQRRECHRRRSLLDCFCSQVAHCRLCAASRSARDLRRWLQDDPSEENRRRCAIC